VPRYRLCRPSLMHHLRGSHTKHNLTLSGCSRKNAYQDI
jgi:hypothetical protein